MRPLFQNAVGPSRSKKLLQEVQSEHFDTLQLQYYDAVKHRMIHPTIKSALSGHAFDVFSSFDDPNKYNGYIPSENFLSHAYCYVIIHPTPLEIPWSFSRS
jgi:hypothetical protein